jgi:lipoprotein signal peptidase
MKDFKHMNKSGWFGFPLFNILDHICTIGFVFVNLIQKLLQIVKGIEI